MLDLQQAFFQKILDRFPGKTEAVVHLAGLLNVSENGIYRRFRGDTLLTPDELMRLAQHFEISVDAIIHRESTLIPFTYNQFARPITNFDTFISQVHENIAAIASIPDVHVYYASQEVPIFQYFFFPELLAFKLYVYGLTAWNFDYLRHRKFSLALVSPHAIELGLECVRLYSLIPSKDLWNPGIIDNTLNQIEYMAQEGRFESPELACLICDQITALLERARKMAEYGKKIFKNESPESNYAQFDLYYNEMINTNNTIMVKTPKGTMMYTTFSNPNFLKTSNQRFCDHTKEWFEATISRSTSISVHSATSRNRFFHRLFSKVENTRKRIELLFEGLA